MTKGLGFAINRALLWGLNEDFRTVNFVWVLVQIRKINSFIHVSNPYINAKKTKAKLNYRTNRLDDLKLPRLFT
jgi:hypothetical protein